MKKNRVQDVFLDQLKKFPIVQLACEKAKISRNSIYRWRREDETFAKDMDDAITEGEAMVNDMSESQLIQLIKEKNFSAIRFWLNKRHPKFKDKLEVVATIDDGKLTDEQEKVVREALQLGALAPENINNTNEEDNYDEPQQ